jgi:hypothetical protein
MTTETRELLDAFGRLSNRECQDVALEILSRAGISDHDDSPLDAEDLARIADETFQEHDKSEAADGPS